MRYKVRRKQERVREVKKDRSRERIGMERNDHA